MLHSGISARRRQHGFEHSHLLARSWIRTLTTAERANRRRDRASVAQIPEVRGVTWTVRIPFAGPTRALSGPVTPGPTISINAGSATFSRRRECALTRGRSFTEAEVASNAAVVIISESLARAQWPGADPIGKDSRSALDAGGAGYDQGLYRHRRDRRRAAAIFLSRVDAPSHISLNRVEHNGGMLLVRTRGVPEAVERPIVVALSAISPTLPARAHLRTLTGGPMAVQRPDGRSARDGVVGPALVGLGTRAIGATASSPRSSFVARAKSGSMSRSARSPPTS